MINNSLNAVLNKEKNRFDLDGDYAVHWVYTRESCADHTHAYIEFVYNSSGSALHFVNGITYPVKKGDLLLIDRGSTHSLKPSSRVKYCNIMLRPSFFDKSLDDGDGLEAVLSLEEFRSFLSEIRKGQRIVHFDTEEQKKIEFLIHVTLEEQSGEHDSTAQMKRSALRMLLTMVFRKMSESSHFAVDNALLEYIGSHYPEKLTAEMLANRCGYTKEHFSRKFKQYTGMNFCVYLNGLRLNRAKELLMTTEKTVDEIMDECGFTSRGEFFRKFRQNFGEPPIQFKKSQKSVQK